MLLIQYVFMEVSQTINTIIKNIRERRQLCFVTHNGNFAISGWVGLAYDR